jgi:hypothetical protein
MSELPPCRIVAVGNTYNPCLIVLRSMGYKLCAEGVGLWTASKDGSSFTGASPPELLGVVTLWENLGDQWNQQDPDILGEIAPELRRSE